MAKRTPRLGPVTPTDHPVIFPKSVKTAPGNKHLKLEVGRVVPVDLGDPWVVKQFATRGRVKPQLRSATEAEVKAEAAKVKAEKDARAKAAKAPKAAEAPKKDKG